MKVNLEIYSDVSLPDNHHCNALCMDINPMAPSVHVSDLKCS